MHEYCYSAGRQKKAWVRAGRCWEGVVAMGVAWEAGWRYKLVKAKLLHTMESVIFGALLIGILSGCVPLIYGLNKNQLALALGGFFACIISGFVLGALLAFPMAGLFFFFIRNNSKSTRND